MRRLSLRNFSLIALSLFCAAVVSAQKFDLGKVSVEELRQSQHSLHPDAPAAVLFSRGYSYMRYNIKDGFYLIHEVSMRIKIYRKEGLSYANYDVPFYVGYKELDKDQISITDAVTYNLVDGKIEKTKGGSEAKLYERLNENWKKATIVLPNVREGSVIEFRYELRSQNLTEFPDFILQRDIPVNYVEYTTDLPNMYVYKVLTSGSVDLKSEAKYNQGHQNYENEHGQTQFMNYHQLHSVYKAVNVPPLPKEIYVDNRENYRGKIAHELESVRFDGEPEKDLSRTWEGVVKRMYKDRDFGEQLKVNDYFMADLKRLVDETDDLTVRLNRVFEFVRNRMNWDGKHQFWSDRKLATAYSERAGNSGEINLILCAMLRMAGLDSNPVLLSTVRNGIAVYPNVTAFNHIIVAVDLDGKRCLMDAIDKHAVPGILPLGDLNWEGRLVKTFGDSESVNLQSPQVSRTNINVLGQLAQDGSIKASVSTRRSDYDAFVFRSWADGRVSEELVREKEKELGDVLVSNHHIENAENLSQPPVESFDVSSASGAEVIGQSLYVSPTLFFFSTKNPFTEKERQFPIFFGYPRQYRFSMSLQLPDGYVVESLPKAAALSTGEGVATFKMNMQQNDRVIQVTVSFETGRMLVAPDFYPILQEFYAQMTSHLQEKIVLKKT